MKLHDVIMYEGRVVRLFKCEKCDHIQSLMADCEVCGDPFDSAVIEEPKPLDFNDKDDV